MIEAATFVGAWPFYSGGRGDARGLLEVMDKEGIARALVSPLNSVFLKDPEEGNERLWRQAETEKERLLPVPCVNPIYPAWREALERCAGRGATGIRLYPNYHGYAVNGEAAKALACECGVRHLVLVITVRMQDERQHHPAARVGAVKIAEIAELIRYCGGQVGVLVSFARLPEILALRRLVIAERMPYCDIAGVQGPESMWKQLTGAGVGDSLVFGSGWPLQYEEVALAKVRLMAMEDELRSGLLHENAESLLRLSGRD
jgi:predicted TIM-barrel fold metal-dependent hydrolase